MVNTHVVRLKGDTHASPPATQGKEKFGCRTLTECDSYTKHGFKMRFFLTLNVEPLTCERLRVFQEKGHGLISVIH